MRRFIVLSHSTFRIHLEQISSRIRICERSMVNFLRGKSVLRRTLSVWSAIMWSAIIYSPSGKVFIPMHMLSVTVKVCCSLRIKPLQEIKEFHILFPIIWHRDLLPSRHPWRFPQPGHQGSGSARACGHHPTQQYDTMI